jgi:hypothetical protein
MSVSLSRYPGTAGRYVDGFSCQDAVWARPKLDQSFRCRIFSDPRIHEEVRMSLVIRDKDTIRRMADAAGNFLSALSSEQRTAAEIDFSDETERKNWHYTPVDRQGLMLKKMSAVQADLAHTLLATGLSGAGVHKAKSIIALEPILGEIEGGASKWKRDPERYYVSVFGKPGDDGMWGWRFEGHHVSVNYTIVDGELIGPTPVFFGSNPAQVLHGDLEGVRALKEEEDVARELLASLDGEQKSVAIVSQKAPDDLLTKNVPMLSDELSGEPSGLSVSDMTDAQRRTIQELIEVYVRRLPDTIAEQELARVRQVGDAEVSFAWAGPESKGEGHYYRVQGATFLAEYDCTQNDANHIHAVWRNPSDDFGDGLLKRHYESAH